ncbi:FAD-binding oxidoreductase [Pseudonocardia phyllosphaerae]|uniref:FAD-binding oxidoreductase n=1 Tax=Pseudonocardia phyllosphaerae TaxID=3390502 RepID=UPI00397A6B8F
MTSSLATSSPAVRSFQTGLHHRPGTVVVPGTTDEVARTLAGAARSGAPVTVHATGHGLTDPADGGILLVTTGMNEIVVDPEAGTARIGAGATWADVVAATAPHGLRPPNGSAPSVGVAGYLFGGGLGLTARSDGWAADHVRAFELVTADGIVRTVDAATDPGEFARLRGTGPSGGAVVTTVTLGLLPAGPLTGGGLVRVLGPADGPGDAGPLHAWHAWTRSLPDDITSGLSLVPYPDLPFLPGHLRGRRVLRIAAVVTGDEERARELLAPLRAAIDFDEDAVAALDPADSARVYAEPDVPHAYVGDDHLVADLDPAGLDAVARRSGPMVVTGIRHLGGAAGRAPAVPDTVRGRDASYLVNALAPFDGDPSEARAGVRGVLDGFASRSLGTQAAFRFGLVG